LRLLLDTTYLLPAIGISVKGLPSDAPIKLTRKGHKIFISDISIFELSAKGAKHITAGTLSGERVTKGVRAIVYDETIETVPMHESTLLLTAFKLKGMLNDFIDCLILSSAINRCDLLITEDNELKKLNGHKEFKNAIATTNPEFKIKTMNETL
jgi:PIN domain nuclease of toxin-antitoxin system